jgi:hypothetical protein
MKQRQKERIFSKRLRNPSESLYNGTGFDESRFPFIPAVQLEISFWNFASFI